MFLASQGLHRLKECAITEYVRVARDYGQGGKRGDQHSNNVTVMCHHFEVSTIM